MNDRENEKTTDKRRELIGLALGKASMCWDPLPAGVFDSTRACEVLEKLIRDLDKL